jgi:hypothetical protein
MATRPKPTNNGALIPFSIHDFTSQDPDYPASELLSSSHLSRGWQTERFAVFPQSLILRFPQTYEVDSVQFLSHQCKIAAKVEVFTANPKDPNDELAFRKLGYFSLSSNEGSAFKSRELKTIYMNGAPTLFVKFILHNPFINEYNFFKQAGVIAISFNGKPSGSKGGPEGQTAPRTKTIADLQMRTQMDPKTLAQIEQLERSKELAIQQEDYQTAKQIKEKIDKLKAVSEQIFRLEQRKEIAIQTEDYDAAKIIKDEIDRLRSHYSMSGQPGPNPHMNQMQGQTHPQRTGQRLPAYDRDSEDNISPHNRGFDARGTHNGGGRGEEMAINDRRNNRNNHPYENERPSNQINQRANQFIDEEMDDRRDSNERPISKQNIQQGGKSESRRAEPRSPIDNNPQKQDLNFDDQPIRAINKNSKNDQFAPENEFPKGKGPSNDQKSGQASVPTKNKAKLDKLTHIFDRAFLNQAYSSAFQERLTSAEKLAELISNQLKKPNARPSPEIFVTSDVGDAMVGAWTLNLSFLEDRPTQMVNLSIQVCSEIFELCKNKQIANAFKNLNEITILMDELIHIITEKITEFKNENIMGWALDSLMSASSLGLISNNEVVDKLTAKTNRDRKPVKGFKEITGRLMILQGVVKAARGSIKKTTEVLLNYAIENLESQTQGVREESHKLILEVFKVIGEEKTMKFLNGSKIRKNHLENLRKDFNDLENEEEDQDEYEPPKKTAVAKPKTGQVQQNKNMAPVNDQDDADEGRPCNFCHKIDQAFLSQDHFDIHLYKECPMLAMCSQCTQVVEVSDYNAHQLSECQSSHLFLKCNKCQQAVMKQDYKAHQSESCRPLKTDGKTFRCPLCLEDLVLRGRSQEDMWRDHLVDQGCPSNDRTS